MIGQTDTVQGMAWTVGEAFSTGYQWMMARWPAPSQNPGEAKQRKARASFSLSGGLAIKWASGPCFSTASTAVRREGDIARHGWHSRE